jgi:adenylylsulfate kinase
MNARTYVLDGDNVRHGLCSDLGFSVEDRNRNIRRIGEMARLFVDAGVIILAAFISLIASEREKIRILFSEDDFTEVYCRCSIEVCEQRDVKGLYR